MISSYERFLLHRLTSRPDSRRRKTNGGEVGVTIYYKSECGVGFVRLRSVRAVALRQVVDRCTGKSNNSDRNLWFITEVQPHGPALRAWLLARFPTLPDVDDLVQETFVRILRAHEVTPVRSARALLYVTARNLALDTVRRQKVVRFETITEKTSSFVFDDGGDILAAINQQQELEILAKAIQSLPDRCRQVMTLRTSYAYTAKQIAARLRISESTVDKALAQGIRLCAVFFAGEGRR